MTDAADPPYVLEERGAGMPRHVVMYASPTRYTYKGLKKNTHGILELIGAPGDVTSVKLDFSQMLESGENIAHAEARGATIQNAVGRGRNYLIFTVDRWEACGNPVHIGVVFSTGERKIFNFIAKADVMARRTVLPVKGDDYKERSGEAVQPIPSIWGDVEW